MKYYLKISFSIFFVISFTFVLSQGFGNAKTLTKWHFNYGDVHLGGRETLEHSEWEQVNVPHDWSVTFPASPDLASCTGYLPGGVAWYRTDIEIESTTNKRYYLYFEGVYHNSEVFFNGKWLGKRPNGYVSFIYEITDYVKPGQKNIAAVRVDHSDEFDSRWYTGSGIYRKVHLISASETHLSPWGTFYTTSEQGNKAIINISSEINGKTKGDYSIKQELLDGDGQLVASVSGEVSIDNQFTGSSNLRLEVSNPKLWSIESPYLYELKTTLLSGNNVIDQTSTNVGIRFLKFDANKGFALNGEWMKIKGVCLHHDAGVLGSAVPKEVWRDRVLKLKEIGVNGIRMSHNPQATDLYDLCDELGMLVMDEAFDEWEYPKKKWLEGWNVGEPGFEGAASYFREWGKKDLESIVKRDRNHPSIVMWSIGNEVDYPNDPYSHPIMSSAEIGQQFTRGYLKDQPHADRLGDIAKELAPIVKKLDPSRPVTAALAGAIMSNQTDYPGALDVVGYNYTEYLYDSDHKKYPERVLYGSENRHDLNAWKSVRDKEFIFGQFLWTGIEYLGEAGRWPSRGSRSGLIDLANNIKARGRFRQSLWSDKPMVYVGTYPARFRRLSIDASDFWDYNEGDTVKVVAYTNTEKVALFLNDEKIGETKKYDDETGIISWEVPYFPGKLKAVGYNGKEVAAETEIVTTYQPKALNILDGFDDELETGDVSILYVQAIDENGQLAKLADNEIRVRVRGSGKLLGIENASGNVAENYRDNRHRLLRGKATIYVQATDNEEDMIVSISSPYMETKDISIKIK